MPANQPFTIVLPTLIAITLGHWVIPLASAGELDFTRDVYVVLQRSCFECHGPDRQESGLRLDSASEIDDSGVVETGDPAASELVRRLSLPRNHDEVMPVVGDPLTPTEVQAIEKWIADGAQWPQDFEAPTHWAYAPPIRPELPTVSNLDWVKEPIDRFVLSKFETLGWQPSSQADKSVLLRRVHLDLIGLPPTLEEVLAFESDSSDDALEKVVDDLLSRPQFGERWARPWLDLARYADSHGFQRDDLRDLWAYRDWVIQALNDDMPFDQFTIEQLAGDLLPGATESQRIATGFHRCSPTNVEAGSLPEETRSEQIIDRVNTTASVWLGSTLECAQCHDHKFDPFTAKEYYEFYAFFNNTKIEAVLGNPEKASSIGFVGASMALSDPVKQQQRSRLQEQKDQWTQKRTQRRVILTEQMEDWIVELRNVIADTPQSNELSVTSFQSKGNTDTYEIRDDGSVLLVGTDPPDTDTYVIDTTIDTRSKTLPPNVAKIAALRIEKWTAPQRKAMLDYQEAIDETTQNFQAKIDELTEQIKAIAADTTEVMVELETPRDSFLFERGDYRSPGESVQPGVPDWLHAMKENDSENPSPDRLDLARWLVDPANPLVARVSVNRWWMELFGEGLVRTPEDFGIKGDRPTHPGLLDWLAVEFVDNGWSMKHIMKTIVLSSTYQQSSKLTDELLELDDRNLVLARGPRVRMDAEMVRDNALAVSGLISLKQSGPPIKPYQPANLWTKVGGQKYTYVVSPGDEKFRRGVYVVIKRGSPYPSFINFDGSPRFACTVQRSRSNTPLQALTLLNDPVFVEAAKAMAVRAATEASEQSIDSTLINEFRRAVARHPQPVELVALRELLEEQTRGLAPDSSETERLSSGVSLPANVSPRQFAAWYAVSTVLLNLHETITKE